MKYLLALLAAVAAFAAHLGYAESSAWLQQGAQWLRQAETAAPAPSAAHFQARVTAVHDGDSVRATDRHGQRHKIRLAYIDAPELQQAHGMAARDALRRLIDGQQVEVAVFDTDQYGREVAQIRLHGRDINLAQIEEALNDMIANNQDREAFNEADIRYHEAVLQSVHNPVLQQLSIAISSLQRAVFERTWMGDEANMPKTLQEHKALFDAIRHQDSEAAEQAALTMIASSTRRLKEIT